jgi:HAD superfamily hydrolase (TIGR01457 family)
MTDNLDILRSKKLFVLDMDGTFYLGDRLIEGSLDFLARLKETGREFLFFTNNSSRTGSFYKEKLGGMNCFVDESRIVTSGDVTIKYLQENYPGAGVYLVGTGLLEGSFRAGGIRLTEDRPEIVVLSFDTTLTYEKITKACIFIRNGARFLATHLDLNCPTEDGFIPDCGAMCAMVEASTGVKPKYLGKPFRETVDMIKRITGRKDAELAFVGDRLYTDIATGVKNGITGILVLTGETELKDVAHSEVKPDYIFESLKALGEAL